MTSSSSYFDVTQRQLTRCVGVSLECVTIMLTTAKKKKNLLLNGIFISYLVFVLECFNTTGKINIKEREKYNLEGSHSVRKGFCCLTEANVMR